MQPFDTLRRWKRRLLVTRAGSFARFLLKRFFEDNYLLTAGALSYTTLLALVPLTATVFGVIAMFPIYQHLGDALTAFLFNNFVPKAAASAANYISTFASAARGLTGLGAAGVLFTSLLTLSSIEDAFNSIWRVPTSRPPFARFVMYCAVLAFGPLLAALSLAISSYLFSLPLVAAAEQSTLAKFSLRLLPALLELVALTAAYKVIPHRSVRVRNALAGGALATVLFECAKYAMAYYLKRASYQQIYGALALIPIFLLWIWVSWLVILLGAILAAALSVYRYRPVKKRLPKGFELYGVLRLLGRFEQARLGGRTLHSADLLLLEPILDDDLLQAMLHSLCEIAVLHRNDTGQWSLARDLDAVSVGEVYEGASLRIPDADVRLPCSGDALGIRVHAALDALRIPLRVGLQRSVGSIYRPATQDGQVPGPQGSNSPAAVPRAANPPTDAEPTAAAPTADTPTSAAPTSANRQDEERST
jgi:membrane protein